MPLLPLVLNFVRKNWFPIAITIAVFSLYMYVQWLRGTIEDLEQTIINKDAEIMLCKENIDDRNNIIEAWSTKTTKENIEMSELKNDIEKLNKAANIQIQRIMKQRAPETCDETIDYFIDLGKQYE